jgi:hypothetical protein
MFVCLYCREQPQDSTGVIPYSGKIWAISKEVLCLDSGRIIPLAYFQNVDSSWVSGQIKASYFVSVAVLPCYYTRCIIFPTNVNVLMENGWFCWRKIRAVLLMLIRCLTRAVGLYWCPLVCWYFFMDYVTTLSPGGRLTIWWIANEVQGSFLDLIEILSQHVLELSEKTKRHRCGESIPARVRTQYSITTTPIASDSPAGEISSFDNRQIIWRMPSSGVENRVALMRTDVLEESVASIIRVKIIS